MKLAYTPLYASILVVMSSVSFAEETNENLDNKTVNATLQTIVLNAEEEKNEVGKTVYTKEDLEKTPNTQKTLSEFLKINPNIQFSNTNNAASNQAEIHASDISIHGALPYNNSFLINGMSFNNDINPNSGKGAGNEINNLDGSSQAVTINTDLLCNLEVLDSNVSARYGKFSGGVISATTCAPKTTVGKIHGSINYDYNNSSWNRFNYIDADEEAEFNDPSQKDAQKNYTKQGFSLNSYGRLTENLGLNLGISQRQSDIKANSTLRDSRAYNEERKANNANLELFYDPSDDLSIKLGIQHFEDQSLRFISNTLTNGITQNSDTNSINLNIDKHFEGWKLKQNLSYQEKQNERLSSNHSQYSWYYSDNMNWGASTLSTEGTSGSIFSKQKSLDYNVSAAFEPFEFKNSQHQINIGAGFSHNEASWVRPTDFSVYFLPSKFGTDCIRNDGNLADACDASYIPSKNLSGQYSTRKTMWSQGEMDVQQDSWYGFIEDRINWNNTLEAVLGLRYDYDSLSKNSNIAPRTAFHYMPFADQRLKFTTGWNRYYDRYLYNFDLQDGINNLQQRYDRIDINTPWVAGSNSSSINVARSQLNLPYANEWLFGVSSELNDWRLQLKYVNRDYKDQYYIVRPNPDNVFERTYTNQKSYTSQDVTLSIENIIPINAFGARHQFKFGFNYSDTLRDYNNADDFENKEFKDVLYNGKITATEDIPASDFNTPITARLSWGIQPHALSGLSINNFLVYKPHYDGLTKSAIPLKDQITHNNLPIVYSYNDTNIPSVVRWDIRTTYQHNFNKNLSGIFGLTINNVTNRHNKYLDTDYYLKSEIGRQIVADVTFKF